MIRFHEGDGIAAFRRWSDEELETMYRGAIRILEEVGVTVLQEEAMSLLRGAGAEIDGDLVRIPGRLVEEAVASAPSHYSVFSSDGETELELAPNLMYFGTGTDMPEFVDLYSGDFRPGRLADCENAAKVAQQCGAIDWIAPYTLAADKDPRVADLYHYRAMRTYSNKPILTLATDGYSLKGIIDMAAAQAGGYGKLKEKPTFVHYTEPISPLQNPEECMDKLLLCAEYGIPVTYTSGVMAGATGPVTLAGTLAVGLAEAFSGLVIHQLKAPGAPFMLGCEASIMDMKTTVCMYGGPEYGLMNSFVGEMGRYLDIPTFGLSGATDANECDLQMGAEMIFSMITAIYGRQNFVHDNGYMGIGQMGALQAILAANELLAFVKRYAEGMRVTEETFCIDQIKEVGPGGDFLTRIETMKGFRKEYYFPEFLNRWRNVSWAEKGRPNIPDKLTAKAKAIVEGDVPVFVDEELDATFCGIIAEHEAFYRREDI